MAAGETPGRCDVVIIGGAVMGTSTALALRRADPSLRVLIIEPDGSYAEAATVRAGFLDHGMDLILKPFDIDAVATRLRTLLEVQ